MRRKRMASFHPVTRRSGVTPSEMITNAIAQSPVRLSVSAIGSAPMGGNDSPMCAVIVDASDGSSRGSHPSRSRARGISAATKITRLTRTIFFFNDASEILAKVHALVERRDLILVPVEHHRRPIPELAQPPLAGLAPSRVIDHRVHVRVEPVLVRRHHLPRV